MLYPLVQRRLGWPLGSAEVIFALYLIHGPIMHMGGYWVPQLVWRAFGLNRSTWEAGWVGDRVVGG